ncbi:nacht ankyrin domain-containing protein [Fusarium mundagurra]|uniref:Nacht ankyrin domain-containing protein n=1 Tax=Fusarium mundagurra TaxID=1567541 RepID=A0A8H5YI38_9HYPO|nr:nacht ankyrin domain-containing protein [Fusarium mundagurra]
MLDDVHDSLPTNQNDTNTYTLGNIGHHNIVIACLPSYGITNAATVAKDMVRSFVSISFGLMVGIGGGIPLKVDMRLGDVVVSKEVIQYDFGKTTGHGHFQRTATLNKPPQILLTAVNKLQADHRSNSSKMPSILADMLQRHPKMTAFKYPNSLQDRLFHSTYEHAQPSESCQGCDESQLVDRPVRSTNPEVHFGVIASGNRVIKHGKTRDKLAQELDALCIEMEAAGLMDSLPCLVVRGICDYADSHKNKQWQEYSAATAAAYAKELLSVISIENTDQMYKASVERESKERREKLMSLLRFKEIHRRRTGVEPADEETCQWLLKDPKYQHWLDPKKYIEHHGFLYIKGIPGAGKTTIMKFAYSHAERTMKDATIISFFFDASGEKLERSIEGMYRSLLWELLWKVPELQDVLDHSDLIPLSYSHGATWTTQRLRDLFEKAVVNLGQQHLFCFVDALDECDREEDKNILRDFQTLGKTARTKNFSFYTCFSSRHYPLINIKQGNELILEHHPGHIQDLNTYIYSNLEFDEYHREKADDLRTKIHIRANGVFLWVKLVVQILNKEFAGASPPQLWAARLQEIPAELSQLFGGILKRDKEAPKRLLLLIEWILYAKRPLRWEELYFALISGLHPDCLAKWEPQRLSIAEMKRFILNSSKGLAEITRPGIRTVQFIHESVRGFLKDKGLQDLRRELEVETENLESVCHDQLRKCCQVYLDFSIKNRVDKALNKIQESKNFPFLEYATSYILHHADSAGKPTQHSFLEDFPLKDWIALNNLFQTVDTHWHEETARLLYILAENNLTNLMASALCIDPRIDMEGKQYKYSLFAALANGHRDAVKVLLQQKMTITQADDISEKLKYGCGFVARKGVIPLEWAIRKGHRQLANLLVTSEDTIPNTTDQNGQTLLSWAAESGDQRATIFFLAAESIDPHAKDFKGRTPLLWAAKNGHEVIVKLLLAIRGIDPHAKDFKGRTPLLWAAAGGHEAVITLLLETEAIEPNLKDSFGYGPMLLATEGGHIGSVALLLAARGIEPDLRASNGQTSLSLAAEKGYTYIVKQLLATNGVNPNSKDSLGWTPLSWAVKGGHVAAVKKLLAAKDIDINAKNGNFRTPLFTAVIQGSTAIDRLFEACGSIIMVAESDGRTPLSKAVHCGPAAFMKLFRNAKTGINTEDCGGQKRQPHGSMRLQPDLQNDNKPSMHKTTDCSRVGVVQVLLEHDADILAKDRTGDTPLSWAEKNGHRGVVQLLEAWQKIREA